MGHTGGAEQDIRMALGDLRVWSAESLLAFRLLVRHRMADGLYRVAGRPGRKALLSAQAAADAILESPTRDAVMESLAPFYAATHDGYLVSVLASYALTHGALLGEIERRLVRESIGGPLLDMQEGMAGLKRGLAGLRRLQVDHRRLDAVYRAKGEEPQERDSRMLEAITRFFAELRDTVRAPDFGALPPGPLADRYSAPDPSWETRSTALLNKAIADVLRQFAPFLTGKLDKLPLRIHDAHHEAHKRRFAQKRAAAAEEPFDEERVHSGSLKDSLADRLDRRRAVDQAWAYAKEHFDERTCRALVHLAEGCSMIEAARRAGLHRETLRLRLHQMKQALRPSDT